MEKENVREREAKESGRGMVGRRRRKRGNRRSILFIITVAINERYFLVFIFTYVFFAQMHNYFCKEWHESWKSYSY